MTLIELIIFIILLAIGGFSAWFLRPIGGWWLAIAGFIAGVMLIPGLFFAYDRYRVWAYSGDESMPPCSCGSKEFKVEFVGENEFHEVCQTCRRHYDKRKDKVYTFTEKNRVPYMRLVKHKGWIRWDS
jgi:hypothetical protein